MKRLRIASILVLFFICIAPYSGKAQTLPFHETFGDFSTKVAEAADVNTDFNNGTVVVYPNNLASSQRLGQRSNSAILTDDISTFFPSFSNPSSVDDNYLVVEPGDGSPGYSTPATPDPFLANYVTSLVWTETFSTGITSGDQFDFNMRVAKLFPTGATQAVYSPKASVRVIARTTNGNTTSDEILAEELLNNLTSDFTFMKNYGFQLFATSVELRVELVYQKGDIVTMAFDDIYYGKAQLFRMKTFEYCVGKKVEMDPSSAQYFSCTCTPTFKIFKDNNPTAILTSGDYDDFSGYVFNSEGNYSFQLHTSSYILKRGKEEIIDGVVTSEVVVYAKPTIQLGFSSAYDAKQVGDLQYVFTNRVEPGDEIGFKWIFDDGTTSTSPHPSHTFDESQTTNDRFEVKLEAYNVLPTCSIDHTETIEICSSSSKPSFGFTATENVAAKTVNIDGITAGFSEYIWNYGDGQSGETKVTTGQFDVSYSELGQYIIRCQAKLGVCLSEHEEVVELCETVTPDVDENDCKDEFTFSVNSTEYSSLRWLRKSVELSTQSPFTYRPVAKKETIRAVIDNGCETVETLFVLEPKGPPHSDFIAVPKGGNLDMRVMRAATNITYDWTVKAYDESNSLLETQTFNNIDPASYTIHGDAVSVVVSLKATDATNSNCHSTTEHTICIPSSTHDCCETCSGS